MESENHISKFWLAGAMFLLAFGLLTSHAHAAVSFDHIETPSITTTGTIDLPFTISGSNHPLLVISGFGAVATNETYTITFNGSANTQTIYYDTTSSVHRAFLAVMSGMTTGTHNLHVSNASGDIIGLVAAEYDGVNGIGSDTFAWTAGGSHLSMGLTQTASSSWFVAGGRTESGINSFPNAPNVGRTLNNSVGAILGDTPSDSTSTITADSGVSPGIAILGTELLPAATPTPASISFIFPTNNLTNVSPAFPWYRVSYNVNGIPNSIFNPTPGKVAIFFSKCPDFNFLEATSSCAIGGVNVVSSLTYVASTTISIPNTANLSLANPWYAYASVFDYSPDSSAYGTELASTSIIKFYLNQNEGGIFRGAGPFATTTPTSSPFYVDCSGYSGTSLFSSSTLDALSCYGKAFGFAIIGFLVSPPDWSTGYLQSSFQSFMSVPPFAVINTFQSSVASSTATTTTDLAINYEDTGQNIHSYTLISSTTLLDFFTNKNCNAACAIATKSNLFTIITTCIWVLAGLVLLKIL